jgi:NitT/TauT family transport system ATP-binding protein
MADRIVILGNNPGRVRTVVSNSLPRPRDYRSQQLMGLVDYLHDIITRNEMPDVPAPTPAQAACVYEPLPDVLPSEIFGLLEYLDARGGKEDVYRIASDTHREFGQVIMVVRAAEMLDLVDTPKRMVVLDRDGQLILKATGEERQNIWRDHLLRLRLYRDVNDALHREGRHGIDGEFVMELMVMNMPHENYERMFRTFIAWGRYGNLFSYDEHTDKITLPEHS